MEGTRRSRTAQAVVAQRAVLAGLGVIDEPYAEQMLDRSMAAIAWGAQRAPRLLRARWVTLAGCAAAVQWFDAQVGTAIDEGVGQIVTIGAGYDTRAWRFAREGVQFFELDMGTTQRDKMRRAPGPGPVFVEADLLCDDAADVVVDAGLDPSQPALFVLEGLTMYLSEQVVRRQLTGLAALGAAGSGIVADFYPPPSAGTSQNRRQLLLQRVARVGSGEGFQLQIERSRAAELFEQSGWTVDQTVGFREVAKRLVSPRAGLPIDSVNNGKSLIAAHLD
ncbi:hypothetical protein BH10ACT3_BH10ACT3_24070 [soil metagenome]